MFKVKVVFLLLLLPMVVQAKGYKSYSTKPLPGTVALTFDDGPNPSVTPKVLKILKKYHAHATFFLVGKLAAKYPKLVKKIVRDGNMIGSHSMSHKPFTSLSRKELHYEITASRQLLEKISKMPVKCVRTPYGDYNPSILDYIKSQGMHIVYIGLCSFDFENPGVDKIVKCTLHYLRPSYVVTLHDGAIGQNRKQMLKALPKIIKGIRSKNLGFSTLCNVSDVYDETKA